jgi:L-threonylcarbamoyladenylate synthase
VLATWPGPHTWLLEPRDGVPRWITGDHPRIAVRVTAHAQAASLCKTVGMAIVSTSANRSSDEPTRSFRDTVRRFRGQVDYILPGRVGDASAPTPIRDAVTGGLVRAG